ncbi:unnamed protein product [Gongylonema pulchrum]|uniref:Uncharacterized protein n=1 Tax=Gongylonema pulchrum TaxID=637853 RepID=A0A183DBP4_9BILA|nr:unnamed protein product [Gongylonema pulchrum]
MKTCRIAVDYELFVSLRESARNHKGNICEPIDVHGRLGVSIRCTFRILCAIHFFGPDGNESGKLVSSLLHGSVKFFIAT